MKFTIEAYKIKFIVKIKIKVCKFCDGWDNAKKLRNYILIAVLLEKRKRKTSG